MNDTTLDLFEQKALEEELQSPVGKTAYELCEIFAEIHEVPVEYVWEEFVNPEKVSIDEVIRVLKV